MQDSEQNQPERGHFPLDLRVLLEPVFFIFLIAVPVAMVVPALQQHEPTLFTVALVLGALGVVLLFLARLPLYRQRRFFTFGPRHLTGGYRRLYYAAYVFIIPCILLLIAMIATWK